MKKKVELTLRDIVVQDFFSAARELERAQVNFDNAIPEYFEIANAELTIAKLRLDVCAKKIKALGDFNVVINTSKLGACPI